MAGPSKAAPRTNVQQRRDNEPEAYVPLQPRNPVEDGDPRYVDMLLVLLFFPVDDGKPTKPNAEKGAGGADWREAEPFVFPFWSGRLMPQCVLMRQLPQLVQRAKELGNTLRDDHPNYFKLNNAHMCGLLLTSSECRVTNHKTDFMHDAFKVMGCS